MGYRVKAKNVIRRNSYTGIVVFDICFVLVVLLLEMALAYQHLLYVKLYGTSGNGLLDMLHGMPYYFQMDGSLPLLEMGTWKSMFGCVFKWWPVNLVVLIFLLLSLRRKRNFEGMEHGSARWMSRQEQREFQIKHSQGCIPLADGLFVNPDDTALPNINEIDLGGSGSGKSFRKLIPDILHMYGSYIITDVKGDLYKFLYKILIKGGYKVRVLNLENLKYSNSFNPLAYCEDDTDIDRLVNTFALNSRREGASVGDAFWEDTLSDLLYATVKYVLTTDGEDKSFERCLRLAVSIQLVNGRVSPSCELDRKMTEMELNDPYSSAVLKWKMVKKAPPETLQSIIESLTTRLSLWANEDMRILTQTDEMDFDSVAEEKTAIFLIVPEGDTTFQCITSMFISTAVQRLKHIAKTKYDGRLPMLVSFELDEFANTGILPKWGETISTIRSQNIRAVMILQNVQQLKKNYEKADQTIMTNCAIFNYLGSNDLDTNKLVSEKLGKTTIEESSRSYRAGVVTGGNENMSDRGLGRELLTQDEIARMPSDKCLVLLDHRYPIYADKYRTEHHKYFSLLGNNRGPKSKNNTDIRTVYEALYQKHRKEYWEIKKALEKPPSMFDSMDEGELQNKPKQIEPQSEQDEKAIEAEFERAFLKDLKRINQ